MGKLSASLANYARQWLVGGIKVQLLTSALSLPVLIAWGLPISVMSIAGNLLSTPFLMGILMLSSLIFLTEITHLPNSFLYRTTECIADIWHYFLSHSSDRWLIGFGAPSLAFNIFLCCIIAIGLWYVLHRYKFSVIWASIAAMGICLIACSLYHYQSTHSLEHIHCINRNNKTIVIDDGFFARKTSYKSPCRYRIKPLLYQHFGTNHIHRWHCTYAGTRSLRALEALLNEIKIDTITFGTIPKKKNPVWLFAWTTLDKKAKKLKTTLDENQTDPHRTFLKKSSRTISPATKL